MEAFALLDEEVEHAAVLLDRIDFFLHFVGVTLEKEFFEELRGGAMSGNGGSTAGVTEGEAFTTGGKSERWEAGGNANFFCGKLVQGNAVTEASTGWMRSAGEEAFVSGMSAIDSWVTDTGEDSHLLAVISQNVEVVGVLKIVARFFREEVLG